MIATTRELGSPQLQQQPKSKNLSNKKQKQKISKAERKTQNRYNKKGNVSTTQDKAQTFKKNLKQRSLQPKKC